MIGSSGWGNAFEYHGHKKFIEAQRLILYEINDRDTSYYATTIPINIQRVRRFWNINDISEVQDNEYGLPIASNFPLIDAELQPNNFLIQFTTSTTHRGAVGKLDEIRKKLHGCDYMMISVVPSNVLREFKHQSTIKIKQYVMRVEHTTSIQLPVLKKQRTV